MIVHITNTPTNYTSGLHFVKIIVPLKEKLILPCTESSSMYSGEERIAKKIGWAEPEDSESLNLLHNFKQKKRTF